MQQLQAFAFLLFAEPDARLRGEAAQLLLLLSVIDAGHVAPDVPRLTNDADYAYAGIHASAGVYASNAAVDAIAPAPLAGCSMGRVLVDSLPEIVETALSRDPLQAWL